MKNKFLVIGFLMVLYVFFFANLISEDIEISNNERRRLQLFPKVTYSDVMSGSFMEEFDDYSVDQFFLRNQFRLLKEKYVFNVLLSMDNNGYFVYDNSIYKNIYPTNVKSINNFIDKMKILRDKYFLDNDVYIGIIPDKNYYLPLDVGLKIDYDYLYDNVKNNLDFKYIELRDCLNLSDYYYTDIHWRQEELFDVVDRINYNLGISSNFVYDKKSYSPFYGSYYGYVSSSVSDDSIVYLNNDILDNVYVDNYEKDDVLYNEKLLGGIDSYDVYLSGASSVIKIYNDNSKTDRKLVLIRDSFGSSLAPLLVGDYSVITLVDFRYINIDLVNDLVDFDDEDVLILYSTLVVNDSGSLKIY